MDDAQLIRVRSTAISLALAARLKMPMDEAVAVMLEASCLLLAACAVQDATTTGESYSSLLAKYEAFAGNYVSDRLTEIAKSGEALL